jgi:hypothetical protein
VASWLSLSDGFGSCGDELATTGESVVRSLNGISEVFEGVYVERCRKTEEKEDREVHVVLRKVEQHARSPQADTIHCACTKKGS